MVISVLIRLITQARARYVHEDLGLDLCLALFPWATFCTTKAAVKMHTLLDLKGSIPSFLHSSDGTLHDVRALDPLTPEPGAIYVMERGYIDFTRAACAASGQGLLRHARAKSNLKAHRVYSMPTDRRTGIVYDQRIALTGFYAKQGLSGTSATGSYSTIRKPARHWCSFPIR